MAELRLSKLAKRFDGTAAPAVDAIDLVVADGEFVVLIGPSGCGKTTTLRMIAGLETPTSGEVALAGRCVNDLPPRDRDVGFVFQQDALYPHLSVFENIAFGLRARGEIAAPLRMLSAVFAPAVHRRQTALRADIDRRVRETAQLLGLYDLLARKPGQLSGGQRRRAAFGRAIVRRPAVFLLDEPLSGLDPDLRERLRDELKQLQRATRTTTVVVTHDRDDAAALGDRIVRMEAGRLAGM